MDTISQAANVQMAKDIHFITAPFRHLWHLLVIFILLMLAPVIVVAAILGLVFGKPLTALEVVALKLLMWAFGHIVFAFWFMLVTRHLEVRRNGGSREGLDGAYARTFIGWAGSFAGATLMIMMTRGENTPLALGLVAVGIVLPAILYGVYHFERGSRPDDCKAVEEERNQASHLALLSVIAIAAVLGWFAWSTHQFSVEDHRQGLAEEAQIRAEQKQAARGWAEQQEQQHQQCQNIANHPENRLARYGESQLTNEEWYEGHCR